MAATIPPTVQPILDEYISLVNNALPGLLAGLYLHGSIALDAFTPGLSDIDAITLTSCRCTPADIAALQSIHQALAQRYPAPQWEGSYLQWQDLGGSEESRPTHTSTTASSMPAATTTSTASPGGS